MFISFDINDIELGFDANKEVLSIRRQDKIIANKVSNISNGVWKSNLKGVIATSKSVHLPCGAYDFEVNLESNCDNSEQFAVELRAYDIIAKKIIAIKTYKCNALKNLLKIDLAFSIEKEADILFEVASYEVCDIALSNFSVFSIDYNKVGKLDISALIGSADVKPFEPKNLYIFDVREYLKDIMDTRVSYDILNLVATFQGLINRGGSYLYIFYTSATAPMKDDFVDEFWLKEIRATDSKLANKEIVKIKNLKELFTIFESYYCGFAVWDEFVPATVNAVSTACGVDNLLPLRYDDSEDSLYIAITKLFPKPILIDLHNKFNGEGVIYGTEELSTHSKKNDAYIWAIVNYLEKGLTSKTEIAYHVDAFSWDNGGRAITYNFNNYIKNYPLEYNFLCNKDYNIKEKSFFYDLFPYPQSMKIAPNDDITQAYGTDYETMDRIFRLQHELADGKMFFIHGYNLFFLKYSSGVNNVSNDKLLICNDVANEGIHGRMLSKYYASALGNALSYTNICNQSIYTNLKRLNYSKKLKTNFKNIPTENKYYFNIVMGDYDGSSWPYALIPTIFNDKNRGKLPLSWLIAPFAEKYIPQVYRYMYENKRKNDYFTCANNGAGFCSLAMLDKFMFDDTMTMLDKFILETASEMDRMGLDIEGHLIVDYKDENLAHCLEKYSAMKKEKPLQAIYSTYWATVPDENFTKLNYEFNNIPNIGVEIDMSNKGMVQPTKDDFKNYVKQHLIFGKIPHEPRFHCFRTVLAFPTVIYEAFKELKKEGYSLEVLDPYNFAQMSKNYDCRRIEFEKK